MFRKLVLRGGSWLYVSFKHILFHMHEKGLVVCCMFDCIPHGTYFIPSDNAVRIIDYSTIQPL